MKYVASTVLCKGFAICRGFITSNDTYYYNPSDVDVPTRYTQIFYLAEGSGEFFNDGLSVGKFNGKNFTISKEYEDIYKRHMQIGKNSLLVDLKIFKGQPLSFKAGLSGASWICINPVPTNKFFNSVLLKENTNLLIEGDKLDRTVICSKGNITINNKILNQFNYTRILEGKTAEVVVPSESEAIYLTR